MSKKLVEMTDKEIDKEENALRDAGCGYNFKTGKCGEGTADQKKRMEELNCLRMINSVIAYGGNTVDRVLKNEYMKKYIDKLGEERVKELIATQLDEIDHVDADVYTDGEGVTYNSIKWKREAYEARKAQKLTESEDEDMELEKDGYSLLDRGRDGYCIEGPDGKEYSWLEGISYGPDAHSTSDIVFLIDDEAEGDDAFITYSYGATLLDIPELFEFFVDKLIAKFGKGMSTPVKEALTEDNEKHPVAEVAEFLKSAVAYMQENEDYTLYKYNLDDKYVLAVYWNDGFEVTDTDVIHSTSQPTYCLVCGVKERNDAEWDGAYLNFPVDENGDLLNEEYTISPDEDFNNLAKYLLDDYALLMSDKE